MSAREAHVELLLGRKVLEVDGRPLGRLEEICAVSHGGELRVSQYLVGRSAVAARLTSASLLPRVLRLLRLASWNGGYVIPWSWMDLSDPENPRCTHRAAELQNVADEAQPPPPSAL